MSLPLSKSRLEATLASRFDTVFGLREHLPVETMPTGIGSIDSMIAGLPKGALTEVFGPASSGRTSLSLSVLTQATLQGQICALVDTCDSFDPASAKAAGIDLGRLLWLRCAGDAGKALQAADLLLQAGGFGTLVFDIASLSAKEAQRFPAVAWFRLRRAVENTPSVLLVLSETPQAKTAASLLIECGRSEIVWKGTPGCSLLLEGAAYKSCVRKPPRSESASWKTQAMG